MRKLGIIGGLSWISTRAYYERINKFVQKRSAPMASPPLLIESLDYAPIAAAKNADDWDSIAAALVESARRLESAGAEGLVVAANTMHKVYDRLTEACRSPSSTSPMPWGAKWKPRVAPTPPCSARASS